MSENQIGVGVIGLRFGKSHFDGYKKNPLVKIIGVCDLDQSRLDKIKEEHGIALAVTDYRQLLANPAIQVVSVATPDFAHAEQSIAALRAGKDVLCEKPLTASLEDALAIVRAVRETGRKFMVGQVCRYAPGFLLAKQMIARGEIGELFLVESEYAHNYEKSTGVGNWRKDPRREPFLGGGCHAVDLLRWIAGDAEEAFAYANHKCFPDWPINDCTMAVFRFQNNVLGKVMVSIGCVRPYTMRSVFYGREGTIVCDNTSPEIQLCSRKNISGSPAFAAFPVNVASHNVAAEIAEFIHCIRNNMPVLTTALEGAKTVQTCLAAAEAARLGKPVKIPPLKDE